MSTVFPFNENARDCTDKGRACRAGGAWLNYYIKSIRRLGRGPDIAAVLGEKSGMIGSCERDACGSARLDADAVRPFAARYPGRIDSRPTRQGISSTDKDVTGSRSAAATAGGFSSWADRADGTGVGSTKSLAGNDRSAAYAAALVDGRYGEGLDSGAVSVKLPVGKQEEHRPSGGFDMRVSGEMPEQTVRRPLGAALRRRSFDRLSRQGGPSPARCQPKRMEGMDPAAICRTQMGIRRERPAL